MRRGISAGRIVAVTLLVGFTTVVAAYALDRLEFVASFSSRGKLAILSLVAIAMLWAGWRLGGVALRSGAWRKTALVSLGVALFVSVTTAVWPWLWFTTPESRVGSATWRTWEAVAAFTGGLQRWLGLYPWHNEFIFGGLWRALWKHSVVAIPVWFAVFTAVGLLWAFSRPRGTGALGSSKPASRLKEGAARRV